MSSRFNDIWTQKARQLGFPSRAMFKLLEANKKYKILRPGQKVVDLGCAPGSWSKLASQIVGPKGIVYSIDIQPLSIQEQQVMGAIDHASIRHDPKKLLKIERKLAKSTSPVVFQQADVTTWLPPREIRKRVDVILSDMAPKTTGNRDNDADISAELCHAVLDLAPQLFRPPKKPETRADLTARALGVLEDEAWSKDETKLEGGAHIKDAESGMLAAAVTGLHIGHMSARDSKDGRVSDDGSVELDLDLFRDENGELDVKRLKKVIRRPGLVSPLPREKELLARRQTLGDRDAAALRTSTLIQDGEIAIDAEVVDDDDDLAQRSARVRGVVFMKVFQGGEHFDSVVRRLKHEYASVQTFKPTSSRSESVEVFLLAKNFLGRSASHLNPFRDANDDFTDASIIASASNTPGDRFFSRKELLQQHREAEEKYGSLAVSMSNNESEQLQVRLRKLTTVMSPTGERALVNEENAHHLKNDGDAYFSTVSYTPREMPDTLKKFLQDREAFEARRAEEAQVRAAAHLEASDILSQPAQEMQANGLTDLDQHIEEIEAEMQTPSRSRRARAQRVSASASDADEVSDLMTALGSGVIERVDNFPDFTSANNGIVWELVEGEEEDLNRPKPPKRRRGSQLLAGSIPTRWHGQKKE